MSIQWWDSTSRSVFLTTDYVGSSERHLSVCDILPWYDMIKYNSKMCHFRSPDQCWVLGHRKSCGSYPPCAWWWHPPLRTGCFWKCILNYRNVYLNDFSDLDYKQPLLWWCNLRLTLCTATVACCLMLAWKVDEYLDWAGSHIHLKWRPVHTNANVQHRNFIWFSQQICLFGPMSIKQQMGNVEIQWFTPVTMIHKWLSATLFLTHLSQS